MIQLPQGFDPSIFLNELYVLAVPFAGILFTIAVYNILRRIIKKV